MLKLIQGAGLTFVALMLAICPVRAEELDLNACQTVSSQVGLIVRDEPSSDGAKLGTLKYGQKVKPVGEAVEGEPLVTARLERDGDSLWVKIKAPIKGWVLFSVDDDPNYTYLVPCE